MVLSAEGKGLVLAASGMWLLVNWVLFLVAFMAYQGALNATVVCTVNGVPSDACNPGFALPPDFTSVALPSLVLAPLDLVLGVGLLGGRRNRTMELRDHWLHAGFAVTMAGVVM